MWGQTRAPVLLPKRLKNPRCWYIFLPDIPLDRRNSTLCWITLRDRPPASREISLLPTQERIYIPYCPPIFLRTHHLPQTSGKGVLYKKNKMFHYCLRTSTRPQPTVLILRGNLPVKGSAPVSIVDPAVPAAPGGKSASYSPSNRADQPSPFFPFMMSPSSYLAGLKGVSFSTRAHGNRPSYVPGALKAIREPCRMRRQGSYLHAVTLCFPQMTQMVAFYLEYWKPYRQAYRIMEKGNKIIILPLS